MGQTVLVADDSQTIRKIVEMALKASTYQVVGVGSAQDAMEAASHAPSVILLDYYMPDGSGYDVCRALKGNAGTSGIPVIMLGGTYQSFDEDLARQSGADGIVMKPFKTDTLIDAIEAVQSGAGAAPAAPEAAAPPPQPEPAAPQYEPEPMMMDPESEPEPVAAAPPPQPQAEPEPPPRTPTPAPTGGSQPSVDVNASSRAPSSPPPATAPATTSGSGPIGVSRGEIEKMIRDEVRSTVKAELPAMLRSVMGETFQQKVLPKLINHTEERVEKMINDRMETAIREQVRVELERLLAE